MNASNSNEAELPAIPYRAIVEQAVAGVYVLQDERFAYCNAKWAEMIGYSVIDVIGSELSRFAPQGFLPELLDLYHRRLNADPPSIHFVTRVLHHAGHELRIEVHGSRIVFRGRPAVMGVGVDITERLRNEKELRESRDQLRQLSAYTARKLEEQRLRFARDVHDQLGGILTSMKMDATRIRRRAQTDEMQELTDGLIELTQKSIDVVRRIAETLRPVDLDHLGLDSVIVRELEDFSKRYGLPHTLRLEVPTQRLPPRRAHAVYRIFHESLTNIARHAQARSVDVRLSVEGERLLFTIQDDGVGFDPCASGSVALGLLSMNERAREIGAELQIKSALGSGTRLDLTVPLV